MVFFRKIPICHFGQPTGPKMVQPTVQPSVQPTVPKRAPDWKIWDFSYTDHVVPRAARKLKTNKTTSIWNYVRDPIQIDIGGGCLVIFDVF